MFKPLLRTIPTLSGNVILGCKIDKLSKTDKNNLYVTDIQAASLYTAQNSIFNKKLNINLTTGKWEHDVRRFYVWFSDTFYSDNFIFDKNNYKQLNLLSREDPQDSRNKDYEFGCRRIKYSQYGYQFQFYAPIYVDSVDSLPDYFEITIKLNKSIKKKIRINIGNKTKYNYLNSYLKHYLDKIDDNVIYCLHDTNQATYFGIDVVNGGLVQVKDDVIGTIYNNQLTINNFDYTICQGFERKKLIMSQVIPLSFMFNISDILTRDEKIMFMNSPVSISGYYYKNGVQCDFYDFDTNYTEYYPLYKKYNQTTGSFSWTNGYHKDYTDYRNLVGEEMKKINVMDIGYPSLKETRYVGYKYTNKLTPLYSKWKLKYSDDKTPYITNMSWAYSYLQNPNYKYGTFPTIFKDLLPSCEINGDNLILPIGNNISTNYTHISDSITGTDTIYNSAVTYRILESNYISEWYNIFTNLQNVITNKKLWSKVIDNNVYHNGILYNLANKIDPDKTDLFSVFLNIKYNKIDYDSIKKIYSAPIIISSSDTTGYKIPTPTIPVVRSTIDNHTIYNSFYNIGETLSNGISYVSSSHLMQQDNNGMYIEAQEYFNRNTYYKFEDILGILDKIITENEIVINKIKSHISRYVAGVEGSDRINSINYCSELLPIANNNNIFEQYVDEETGNVLVRFTLSDKIFADENLDTPEYNNNEYIWLKDKLYVVTSESTEKKRLYDIYKNLSNNEMTNGKISVFLKNEFINKRLLLDGLRSALLKYNISQTLETLWNLIEEYIVDCQEYNFIPYSEDNGITNTGYFVKNTSRTIKDTILSENLDDDIYKQDIVYIDTYNLVDFLNVYIESKQAQLELEYDEKIVNGISAAQDELVKLKSNKIKTYNFFSAFINRDHIKEYIHNTNSDIYRESHIDINMDSPEYYMKHIYAKTRILITDNTKHTIEIKDTYIPLDEIIEQNDDDLSVFLGHLSEVPTFNGRKFKINVEGYIVNKEKYFIDDNKVDNFIYLELCFNKDFIIMDHNIKTMLADTGNSLAMYLYRVDNSIDKNTDMFPAFKYDNGSYIHIATDKVYDKEVYNIYSYLHPIYTDIYVKNDDVLAVERMINTRQIKEVTVEDTGDVICIYSPNDCPCFVEITKELKEMLGDSITYYSPYLSNTMNMIACEGATYDPQTQMNTYVDEESGLTYSFYLFEIEIDNSSNSFKISGDENTSYIFNKINGKEVNEKYIESIFKKIHPFLKQNIFDLFSNNIKTILFPAMFDISIKYAPYIIDNGYTPESEKYRSFYNVEMNDIENSLLVDNGIKTDKRVYDIKFVNNRQRKIKILRYFNSITPLIIKKDNINNCFGLKYKDFVSDADANNIYNETISIYKYPGIYVKSYNPETGNFYTHKVNQYEYKHFNDNKMYNLKSEMQIKYPKYVDYDNLLIAENEENTLNYFIKCINSGVNKKYSENEILFLFNKYKVNYLSTPIKLDIGKSNKLYQLTYKFTLI